MKKLLLAAIAFFSLGALWLMPGQVAAASMTVTSAIRANGSDCKAVGSISPAELTFNYNDNVTINFKNEQRGRVEVRNVPGGTFQVAGNSMVERTFRASGSFTYTAWSTEGNCEKATGRIEVHGGWWVRTWPWVLACIGSIVVIWLVSRAGRHSTATQNEQNPKLRD